jgi:hypothetical protein
MLCAHLIFHMAQIILGRTTQRSVCDESSQSLTACFRIASVWGQSLTASSRMASKFGGVEDGGYRFRIHVEVSSKNPKKMRGPWHQDQAQAQAELTEARRCCATRAEMYEFIVKLNASQTSSGHASGASQSAP